MADGGYRFAGAGQFYYNQQNPSRQLHTRHGSPVNSARIGFHANDTPSPNRSPGTLSPAFSMFGANHQQNQHALLNGQSHQRYQMQMNSLAKHFQTHGGQHQAAGHHPGQQHHDHTGHNGHANNFGTHQHNMSSGTLNSATPHFTPSHLQNGTPLSSHPSLNDTKSEHWLKQITLAQTSREAQQPHSYARVAHTQSRQAMSGGLSGKKDDEPKKVAEWRVGGPRQAFDALDFSGQGLKTIAPALFNYQFLEKLYLNGNKLTWLSPLIGRLRNLTYLDLSQNQLTDLPSEIGMLVNLKTLLLFDNHLETLPEEVGYLFQVETLGLEGNPLNEDIKHIVAESGTAELIRTLRESAQGPPPPNERDWIQLEEPQTADEDRFSAITYNILCEKAATPQQYGYCPSSALAWEHRREQILAELRARNADIICLQEVDVDSFNNYFREALAHDDYKGMFWPKSRAQTMGEVEANKVDGCATFYKNSKFICLAKDMIDFRRNAINRPDMKGEHDIFNRVMTRDDIATVAFLENRYTGARLMVVNTHVFWNPTFADVKVIQVAILLEQLHKFSEKWSMMKAEDNKELFKFANGDNFDGEEEPVRECAPSQKYDSGPDIPLIICGDFNSTPDSGVCDLISHGSLASSHKELQGRNYGKFTREGMTHPFSLKSSYSSVGELEFTNYTWNFKGVLDYIWYSTNALNVAGLLGGFDPDYMSRIPGFPHVYHQSDHVPLMAEFVVKGRKEKKHVEADFGHR